MPPTHSFTSIPIFDASEINRTRLFWSIFLKNSVNRDFSVVPPLDAQLRSPSDCSSNVSLISWHLMRKRQVLMTQGFQKKKLKVIEHFLVPLPPLQCTFTSLQQCPTLLINICHLWVTFGGCHIVIEEGEGTLTNSTCSDNLC